MTVRDSQHRSESPRPGTFDVAEKIADAVLYEGYVLYPYRASAAKNQFRWQFGVVAPRAPRDDGEPWFARTECLIEPTNASPQVSIRIRFLRPRRSENRPSHSWLEGEPHAIDVGPWSIEDIREPQLERLVGIDIDASVLVRAEALGRFSKIGIQLENHEPWLEPFDRDRDDMLRHSLVGAHLLMNVDDAAFVSLLEPSPDAVDLAGACDNCHTWPVLVGDRARRNLMLSSPIVLYDFPAVAPESQGDLCDAAEIDEILSLRILTMTEQEKQEARATDPRAKAILDRVEALTPDGLSALHGAIRNVDFFNPRGASEPDQASVTIGGHRVAKGSRVRLRPNCLADAMDMFLKDQTATVAGVYRDVDDRTHVAVTVDADPAASLHESFGRFFYFDPTEIEPLERGGPVEDGAHAAINKQERV